MIQNNNQDQEHYYCSLYYVKKPTFLKNSHYVFSVMEIK